VKKRAKIESKGWPAWAVVVRLPGGDTLVRQVAQHRESLRCIWAAGEQVVEGTFTFVEGAPAKVQDSRGTRRSVRRKA